MNETMMTPQREKNDTVLIQLDRPRELRLGHKALKRFSALTGVSMQDMGEAIQHYDNLACLMYVMLSVDAEKHDEILSAERVDDLLEDVPISRQLKLCAAAVEAAFGDAENQPGEDADDPPPEAAGTGTEA